ncbi:MAG: hypothetical protein PHE03_04080 [Bacteroidales bacterium]|nr:hypothetical protein [Bacteroidales bacterium]
MTVLGYQSYLSEDKDAISNYQTEFSRTVPTEEIGELIIAEDIRDSVIMITEMQLYLNSLGVNTKRLHKFIGEVVAQSRKRDVDIFYDSQRYTDIHPRLRVQTDRAFLPRKFHLNGSACSLDRCKKVHIIKLFQHDPFERNPILTLRADVAGQLYDSNEIVICKKEGAKT